MTIQELENASGGTIKQTKYLKTNPLRQFLIRQYLDTVLAFARQISATCILDVGCGEGFVARHLLSNMPEVRITGIDLEPGVLKVASYLNPNAGFSVASADQLPVISKQFDLVLTNEVLEHVPEPNNVLDEVERVGSKHFILSVPREPHYRLANMAVGANWSRWGDDIDHCQRWTKRQFVHMLSTRFDVLAVKTPFPWTMVLCRKRP